MDWKNHFLIMFLSSSAIDGKLSHDTYELLENSCTKNISNSCPAADTTWLLSLLMIAGIMVCKWLNCAIILKIVLKKQIGQSFTSFPWILFLRYCTTVKEVMFSWWEVITYETRLQLPIISSSQSLVWLKKFCREICRSWMQHLLFHYQWCFWWSRLVDH